jgi:predicted alpha/beta-hydrolase family hydrolase
MVWLAEALCARGLDVVTFNFLYMQEGRHRPDPNEVLEATWKKAIEAVRTRPELQTTRLFIGGLSLGARIATQVAASPGVDVAGLVLLSYPLFANGDRRMPRGSHFTSIRSPMLFVQGSHDDYGTPAELEPFLGDLPAGADLVVIEEARHDLRRPVETAAQTLQIIAEEVEQFVDRTAS